MKDPHLLPYILPNVFSIATIVSPQQFASLVLPSLKPLFAIKEPPQNMLTLLDNLNTLQDKTEKSVFRERTSELPFMSPLCLSLRFRCPSPCIQRSGVGTCFCMLYGVLPF